MKYLKLLALALGVVAFASCTDSDKVDYNTNPDVTVAMGQTTLEFKENRGLINVPVVVTGETNGMVSVTVEVAEVGGAINDVHFLMTSLSLNIEEGATEGYLEVKLTDDLEENDPRSFSITIVSATGAVMAGNLTTTITILDNDSLPYEKLAGEWTMYYDEGKSMKVKFVPFEEGETTADGELGYGQYYWLEGLFSASDVLMTFYCNEQTGEGHFAIPMGQTLEIPVLSGYNFTDAFLCGLTASGNIIDSGDVIMEWNEDFREISIASVPERMDDCSLYYVVEIDGSGYGLWDSCEGITGFSR